MRIIMGFLRGWDFSGYGYLRRLVMVCETVRRGEERREDSDFCRIWK